MRMSTVLISLVKCQLLTFRHFAVLSNNLYLSERTRKTFEKTITSAKLTKVP